MAMNQLASFDYIKKLVAMAIEEDVATGDITADLIPSDRMVVAEIITREKAVLCGCLFVDEVYRQIDPTVQINWRVRDAQLLSSGQVLCRLEGSAKSLLTGERTALNFLQTLSGTATTTHRFVDRLKGSNTQLLDTRKTIPGLRYAQKYAVRCGGAKNHRMGLFDAFLIKENHILACGSIAQAIKIARQQHPDKQVEVEVESFIELQEALDHNADIILLDNFNIDMLQKAVEMTAGRSKLEVSGGITEEVLPQIAATGVDFISVGALTKHITAVDLSMRIID